MIALLVVVLSAVLIAAPHRMALDSAPPRVAASIWSLALCLRVLAVLYAAVFVVLMVTSTGAFQMVTHWCWHTAVPLMTRHVGLSGHSLGDAALMLPLIGVSVSVVSVTVGLVRAARAVSCWIGQTSIGPGPQQSVIVGEHDVVVATAGMRQPRVIVSAGALTAFDDEELAASLAHEHGHIVRRHRFVLIFAEMCRAIARFLPGTRAAMRELNFHLERDADRFAVDRQHDPSALASAICKAAVCRPADGIALMALGGDGGVTRRVRELLGVSEARASAPGRHLTGLVCLMAVVCATLVVALPSAAEAGISQAAAAQAVRHCPV